MHNDADTHAAKPVKRVVIAGGGTAGWMAAAAVSKILGGTLEISLIESEEIGTVGVGEATIPTLSTFHRLLDIDEREFMAATRGTIKLGISFENWRTQQHRYIHSFGTTGRDHWSAGFQHFWRRGHELGLAGSYDDYCVELQAALQGKFAHLKNYRMNYAYHLDASLYAKYLRAMSERNGCRRIEGKIVEVLTDADSGYITALRLERGEVIEGDLFIDCTGFRALLIDKTMGVGFEDWSHWLLNDSAIAVQTTSVCDPVPYTRAIAEPWGWQWRIALQHRVGNGIVYSSRHVGDEEAKQRLMDTVDGEVLKNPWPVCFRPGRRLQCWNRNCVALGLAGSFIEPLESTTIHLIQRGITHLMRSFPQVIGQAGIDEYNTQMADELQHVRDFVVLHYYATERRDTPYWEYLANMELPQTLRRRIELFRETGTVFHVPGELFAENSWIQVMMGQGITPKTHHPTADTMSEADLRRFLDDIRTHVETTVRMLPSHQAYLDQYCPSGPRATVSTSVA